MVWNLSPGHLLVCPTFVSGSLQSVDACILTPNVGRQDSEPSQMNWKIRELVSILWPSGDQHSTSFNGTDNNFNAIKPPISLSTSKAEFTITERWNPRGEGMQCGTDRNIRCKLYPQRFILVLSGTLPVFQQMSSTTHEILITIRFSSTKHPALIHMDMIYTWHSPSPSKLYIYHFRLRLRRVISWVTRPRGPAVARFYDTIIFTARVLQYFFEDFFCNIFFSVGWVWSHLGSIKARRRKSSDCNIKQYWVPSPGLWTTLFIFIEATVPIRFLKLIQYIFNRSHFKGNF